MCSLCISEAVTTMQIFSKGRGGNKLRTNWIEPSLLAGIDEKQTSRIIRKDYVQHG
jgi:hypothetical protein